MNTSKLGGVVCAAAAIATVAAGASTASANTATTARHAQHVLLLSVDGMHQRDLSWYAARHPHSALAALLAQGTSYSRAQTPVPSDSFPGMVGQVTGGNPRTTGVYYDDTFNHAPAAGGDDQLRPRHAGRRGRVHRGG